MEEAGGNYEEQSAVGENHFPFDQLVAVTTKYRQAKVASDSGRSLVMTNVGDARLLAAANEK